MAQGNSAERLEKLIGFDAAKRLNVTKELFGELVDDIKKERLEKAKISAREQLVKAIELREQMVKVEKEFENNRRKFEKELGKLLNSLEASLNGQQPPTEEEPQEPAEQK